MLKCRDSTTQKLGHKFHIRKDTGPVCDVMSQGCVCFFALIPVHKDRCAPNNTILIITCFDMGLRIEIVLFFLDICPGVITFCQPLGGEYKKHRT